MSDVFTPPEAELHEPLASGEYGSVESAIEGRYEFTISALFADAKSHLKGFKTTFLLAALAYIVISIVVQVVTSFLAARLGVVGVLIQQAIIIAITAPLAVGLFMLAIKRSVQAPIAVNDIFSYYNKVGKLLLLYIVMYIMLVIGFILLVLPGIYLAIAYTMAIPLLIEKDMGVWQALETSRKTITKRWFTFLGFGLLCGLILLVAAIPLGIGLIWAGPFIVLSYGILYRNIFGIEPSTLNS